MLRCVFLVTGVRTTRVFSATAVHFAFLLDRKLERIILRLLQVYVGHMNLPASAVAEICRGPRKWHFLPETMFTQRGPEKRYDELTVRCGRLRC